jgi:glycosyltransferase involved in cell wall biosynthesis
MRILLANESRAGGGGVETYLASIAGGLEARGHAVALLYANPSSEDGPTRIETGSSWSVADLGLERAVAQALDWRPDVVYSHNMGRLEVDEALTARAAVVKMMHGYFGTCVSGQKAFLFPGPVPCSRVCGPACLALYAPRRCGRLHPAEAWTNYRWASRQRALFDRYHAIVVASRHMRDEYLAHGVPAARLHAIPLFAGPHPPASGAGTPVDLVFAGRLTPLKGPLPLVRAAEIAARSLGRTISIAFAGAGPERAALAAQSSSAVEVQLPGWLDPAARTELFARAAALAVPSLWPEPFGLVGLEAAAVGVPAIAFATGGIDEWLTDDVNGILVRPVGDVHRFALAIVRLLAHPEERARLAAGAREAAARLSADAHLSRLEAVLTSARMAVAS